MCLLFAKPVRQEMAGQAFLGLEAAHLTSPAAIRRAGWQRLVHVLDETHYVRYDESTAATLLQAVDTLGRRYRGSMRALVTGAHTPGELARRLQEFSGIGPKASEIFMRELARAGWRPAS